MTTTDIKLKVKCKPIKSNTKADSKKYKEVNFQSIMYRDGKEFEVIYISVYDLYRSESGFYYAPSWLIFKRENDLFDF